ncbi:thioredoxin domain-containing protein [Candidatus Saccharibacteria bacterium]|nr:thioredoxin domain-containing protein [Candidatus Saccharibacteria bacterium]
MKQIIIAILVIVAIIGGAVVLGKDKDTGGQVSNYVYGKSDSSVVLEEFGDFECPACGAYYPIIEQVKEKYKDKIAFQFHHNPLVQIHRNALAAHRAAEAAGKQGKFWEMYTELYSNQEEWNGPSQADPVGATTEIAIGIFEGYAAKIGLDVEKYKADVQVSSTLSTINADIALGKSKYEVTGTPTFVLNGEKFEDLGSLQTLEQFSERIDAALGENTSKNNSAPSETSTAPKDEE